MDHTKTVIIIAGPTAVGKTSMAMAAARMLKTEIISADSRQCYRELNIGVAKPEEKELKEVKHFFVNTHSIHDEVNAVVFEQYALDVTGDIFSRSDYVVMAGGTGLYLKAFCEGMDDIPAIDPAVREQIVREYDLQGLDWLQQQVREKDPVFWRLCEQQNPQRLMRALEVIQSTGESITSYRKGATRQRGFNIIRIGLELPRDELYDRINARVDDMVRAGLVEEARSLYPLRHLNALQTVGYTEL
ncbi:MAG: tRNA dimethylallyltransferase, partial [Chitinophagaceae bacterium]|nr:tRNA dimethylallyltransferase [Chitinophagaceae bacterium]